MSDMGQSRMSPADHYGLQMGRLAAIGANLCGYSMGDPEQWAKGPCDCKFLPLVNFMPEAPSHALSEHTGCCEIRTAWRALAALRDRAIEREGRVI